MDLFKDVDKPEPLPFAGAVGRHAVEMDPSLFGVAVFDVIKGVGPVGVEITVCPDVGPPFPGGPGLLVIPDAEWGFGLANRIAEDIFLDMERFAGNQPVLILRARSGITRRHDGLVIDNEPGGCNNFPVVGLPVGVAFRNRVQGSG